MPIPPASNFCALACATAVMAISSVALAQMPQMFKPGPGPDDLFDVTMKMEVAGMPAGMPEQKMQMCKRKDAGGEKFVPERSNCTTKDFKVVGNTSTFTMVCTGDEPMTAYGEFTGSADNYSGRMRIKGGRKGEEMEMTQSFTGHKVGTCTDTSAQAIASLKAQGDDALEQTCSNGLQRLEPDLFVGTGAPCKTRQKQFCDKVGGIAGTARTAAGFRAASAQVPAAMLTRAFAACGQDFEAVRKSACANGVSTRDWTMVGSGQCDADVRAQGDLNCKGRSFTGSDPALGPLCNRYAALTRGAEDSDEAANTPPPARKANPVEEGVNQLRKLLPF